MANSIPSNIIPEEQKLYDPGRMASAPDGHHVSQHDTPTSKRLSSTHDKETELADLDEPSSSRFSESHENASNKRKRTSESSPVMQGKRPKGAESSTHNLFSANENVLQRVTSSTQCPSSSPADGTSTALTKGSKSTTRSATASSKVWCRSQSSPSPTLRRDETWPSSSVLLSPRAYPGPAKYDVRIVGAHWSPPCRTHKVLTTAEVDAVLAKRGVQMMVAGDEEKMGKKNGWEGLGETQWRGRMNRKRHLITEMLQRTQRDDWWAIETVLDEEEEFGQFDYQVRTHSGEDLINGKKWRKCELD